MLTADPNISHLTPKELAARLRVTPGTLANWRCRRLGPPYITFGSRVLYSLAAVEAWEAEHTRETRRGDHA